MTKTNKETGIKTWPKDERPREKLFKFGEHTLINSELLAILLRSGVKGQSAIDLARMTTQESKKLTKICLKKSTSELSAGHWCKYRDSVLGILKG